MKLDNQWKRSITSRRKKLIIYVIHLYGRKAIYSCQNTEHYAIDSIPTFVVSCPNYLTKLLKLTSFFMNIEFQIFWFNFYILLVFNQEMDNNLEDENIIKAGDHVVVQRQGYTKLHKVKKSSKLILGTFNVEMSNIIGSRYFDMFQIKNIPGGKNLYTLEKVEEINSASGTLNIEESGKDNRNIPNNAESQNLTKEDIDKLKEEQLSSNSIIGELINNSKTFNMKTGYSQEKYIKKKEKKYFEYIQLRRPSIRLLAQMFYRQDYAKTLGIRIDDLSQMLTYANIHQEGRSEST